MNAHLPAVKFKLQETLYQNVRDQRSYKFILKTIKKVHGVLTKTNGQIWTQVTVEKKIQTSQYEFKPLGNEIREKN